MFFYLPTVSLSSFKNSAVENNSLSDRRAVQEVSCMIKMLFTLLCEFPITGIERNRNS
jgi:hypothetical protein